MADQVFISVDLGAESGRVVAGRWNGRTMVMEELASFPNGPVSIGGTLRWDVLGLWAQIQKALAQAARRYGRQVVSVGVDTWGVDYALLSANSEVLGWPYHYRDARTHGVMEQTLKTVSREEIFAVTGLQFMPINTLYQLLAMRHKNPEVFWIADRFLMMPDFFHWCLCGTKVTEFTNATTTQCFNALERKWAVDMLRRLDLPTKMFPEVITPGTHLGLLREEVAERTGLHRIQVVAPATHDTASAVVAVPTQHTGKTNWAYISSGTWALMGVELQDALLSERVQHYNLTNEGGIDHTYRLLKNIMGLWLEHRCLSAFAEKSGTMDPNALALLAREMAEEAPAFRSFVDPDDTRFLNPDDMPATIREYCRETGQEVPQAEGPILRCIYESLALKFAMVLEWLEELTGNRIEVLHIVSGGSRNQMVNQFTANACNRMVLAGPTGASVLGNLLVQARTAGEIRSLNEMREVARISSELREFVPEAGTAQAWQEARERFRALSKFEAR
jgi:rhamnulokinase